MTSSTVTEPTTMCVWSQGEWDGDGWDTSCDETACIPEGLPSENKMRFCWYCGKPLLEIPWVEPAADEDEA